MGELVAVQQRVHIIEAQGVAQVEDVLRIAGEELPAGADAELVHVLLQVAGLVQLRLQGDGVHEDIPAEPVAEHLLHLAQVRSGGGAVLAATGIHHVEHHDLAAYQVFVEVDFPALVGEECGVWELGADGAGPWLAFRGDAERAQGHQPQCAGAQAADQVSASVHE
ncbi:hypothetical protein D3C76_1208950 [compost metagenome]